MDFSSFGANKRLSPSSQESRLTSSPIFRLELDGEEAASNLPHNLSTEQFEQLKIRLKDLIQPNDEEEKIRRDVNACVCLTMQEDETLDLVVLASRLSSYGYIPVLRTAPGGGHGVDCFKNLHHSFICLHKEAEDDGRHIFVDPNFKEQFILQPRVDWYDNLLEIMPNVFVGNQSKIGDIVQLLTKAMEQAFTEQGCNTPPWRSSAALLSKWLPKKGTDMKISIDKDSTQCASTSAPTSLQHQECQLPQPFRPVHVLKPMLTPSDCVLSCSLNAAAGVSTCSWHL